MSDTESDGDMITEKKLARLRAIFDPERTLENDDDLLELAKYVEDESDEADNWVDHDFDFGADS